MHMIFGFSKAAKVTEQRIYDMENIFYYHENVQTKLDKKWKQYDKIKYGIYISIFYVLHYITDQYCFSNK